MAGKTWFLTGTSKGFGREWAIAALDRGDRVAATARNIDALKDLADTYGDAVLPLQLDVTDREAVFDRVRTARDHFDRLDVVINNAGYGHFGMIEELTEREVRTQVDTNLFGPLWVTQAALPYLREQRSGHIIQVSSIGGITAFGGIGAYHASKWGLEGFSQALAQEVAGFGIKVTVIEPTGYDTDWAGPSAVHSTPNPAYQAERERIDRARGQRLTKRGDPTATRAAILQLVDAETPPLRIFFGDGALGVATANYESRLATWREWEWLSIEAHGPTQ
jgi:NAD(P)-dependent dehydrogenase (short-subunit alcohol dehydrogenase family)